MDPWAEVHGRFDPERAAEQASWRADRPSSPANAILEQLQLDTIGVDVGPFLVTGTVGTGKTTELLRIAESRATGDFVVVLDLVRHFHQVVGDDAALRRVTGWEVVFLSGVAVIAAAQERLGFDFDANAVKDFARAWQQLAAASETESSGRVEVDLPQLARSMFIFASAVADPSGALPTLLTALPAVKGSKWTLPLGVSKKKLPDQSKYVQSLMGTFNQLVGQVQSRSRRVLLVLDGLDRITDTEHAEQLFLQSTLLSRMACRAVIAAPFALRSSPSLGTVRGFDIGVLVNEPVLDEAAPNDPSRHGPGVDFMCEIYDKRTPDLPALIAPSELRRLAYYSGGRARDFVRLIRNTALRALVDKSDRATSETVTHAIDELRRLRELGLHKGHHAVLRSVMDDPHHRCPDSDLTSALLATDHLLPYPNGKEWFYPHPLLLLQFLKD